MDADITIKKAEKALGRELTQFAKYQVLEDTIKIQRGLYALRLLEDTDKGVNYTEEVLQRIRDLESFIGSEIQKHNESTGG